MPQNKWESKAPPPPTGRVTCIPVAAAGDSIKEASPGQGGGAQPLSPRAVTVEMREFGQRDDDQISTPNRRSSRVRFFQRNPLRLPEVRRPLSPRKGMGE